MKARVLIGAHKYAVYLKRKVLEKTLNFFSFPARLFAAKDGILKDYKMYGKTLQSNLPEGYTQLESLSSSGYEYINTGLVVQSGDEIQLDYEYLGPTPSELSADMMFFGCQNADTSRGGVWVEIYRRTTGSPSWYVRFGSTSSASKTVDDQYITGRHLVVLRDSYFAVDGNLIHQPSNVGTFQTTPLTLFGRLNQTGEQLNGSKIKVFGLKVINNGVVRLNLIPCKNADNILGMYDTITEQFLANAGTGEFLADGEAQPTPTEPIAIKSVGDKTKNLFDKETITKGAYLNPSGQRTANTNFGYSDFIKVEPGKTYTISGKSGAANSGYRRVHGYNSSQTWLNQILAQQVSGGADYTLTFTAEEDCEYIRFSGVSATNNYTEVNSVQIEEGDVETSYEPYGMYKIPVNVASKNLFNKDNIIEGYRLRNAINYKYAEGNDFVPDENYYVSSLVEVKVGKTYTKNSPKANAFHRYHTYNEDKVCVRYIETNTITINDGEKYIALCGKPEELDTTQLEEGETTTVYEPYFNETTSIYLDEPLRKLGDYTDYIDFENQKVVRKVYCQTDIYGNPSISAGRYLCNANMEGISTVGNMTITWSNLLQDGSMYGYFEFSNIYNYIGMYRNTNNVSRIVVSKILGCQTVEDFQNALKGIEIYYPLRTPTEESITLPAITLQQGNLSMDIETKIKPSQLTITGDIDDVR